MAAYPIVDDFLEGLVAALACRGTTRLDVDDGLFLKALGDTHLVLQARIDASRDHPDAAWTDFLIEVRDVFKPGLLGTHAAFGDALLRARCIRSRAHRRTTIRLPGAVLSRNIEGGVGDLISEVARRLPL
jgi:hypothetical protein